MHRTVSFTNSKLALAAMSAALLSLSGFSIVGCGSSSPSTTTGNCTTLAEATSMVFNKYSCAQASCHDASGSSAGFMMTGPSWPGNLVGGNPKGGQTSEACTPSDGPYLVKGSNPATGLFINKISGTGNLCSGGVRMPYTGAPYPTAAEVACVTQWATTLTMQ